MSHEKTALPDEIQQLSQQFEAWRSAHPPRSRLPETMWTTAADMAQRHGLHRTAKTLRLDYTRLKKHLADDKPVRPAPTQFLELLAAPATQPTECVVEVESSRGRMRVAMKGVISQQEQPTCFRYYQAELLHEFRGALTNPPGHGISLVARWADPPRGLEALVADALQLHGPRRAYDFYGMAQWHATISSLCRTQTCPWGEPLCVGHSQGESHLPKHFPDFVQQATAALQMRCKELTLTFHDAFLDASGYMGVRGNLDDDCAILTDITQLVNEYAQRYPQEGWLALITPDERCFGPKYQTFLPHVTLGRAYDDRGSFPIPLTTSARRVSLPEPLTVRTQHVHIVHYAYRSLLRCVGDLRISLDMPLALDAAGIANHLRITNT